MPPKELRDRKRWILWRSELRRTDDKENSKVPYSLDGFRASSTNPNHWSSYDEVVGAMADDPENWSGIGFVFAKGDGLLGIDLDDCIVEGKMLPWAQALINEADTYYETSPSGTGVKLFCQGEFDERWRHNRKMDDGGAIEVYSEGRYFTFTGRGESRPLSVVPASIAGMMAKPESTKTDEEVSASLKAKPTKADKKNCTARVMELPDCIDGKGAHNTLLKAVCEIIRFGLVGRHGREILDKYNEEKCFTSTGEPYPWSKAELDHKWEDGKKDCVADGTVGCRLVANEFEDVPIEEAGGDEINVDEDRPRIMTTEYLWNNTPETKYIIQNVLAERQAMMIYGAEKTLKTSILIDMATSIATGRKFLGNFEVIEPRKVLVISGESGCAALRSTSMRVAAFKELMQEHMGNLLWSETLPMLGDKNSMRQLKADLVEHRPEVVAIDPMYLALPGADAGNLFIMGGLLRKLGDLCKPLGITLVYLHHSSRKATEGFSLRNSSYAGFAEFARQWISIERQGEFILGKSQLKLDIGGSAGHTGVYQLIVDEGVNDGMVDGRRWETQLTTSGEGLNEDDEKVLAIVKLLENPKKTEITEMTDIGKNRVSSALMRLAEAGHVKLMGGIWVLSPNDESAI